MKSKLLTLGAVVSAMVVALLLGANAQQPDPAKKQQPDAGVGKDNIFVPIPFEPEEKSFTLPKLADKQLESLSEKDVTVRFVSGPGIARPRLLPVYLLKTVSADPQKIGPNGQPVSPQVVVAVFDVFQHPAAERALAEVFKTEPKLANHVKVMPEGRRVGAVLSVVEPGQPTVVLGRVEFTRAIGTTEHTLRFPIDSTHACLLAAKDARQFRVEFEESYLGDFQDDDLRITVTNTREAVQRLRTTITRTAPDGKIAFVRFGGGANQETGLNRYLQSQTLFDMRYNAARVPNRELLDRFFNTVVPVAFEKVKDKKFGEGDDEKVLTYIFSNGMTVQGTVAEFKKIDDKARYEMRRNAEDRRTWNRVADSLRKGSGGGGINVVGLFSIGGSGSSESRDINTDIGSDEAKRFSEDIADLFQSVEGKVPVLALDVDQLVKAETAAAEVVQAGLGQFRRGRRTIVHPVSFETLHRAGKLPAFKTDLDKQVESFESRVPLGAMLPYFGTEPPSGFVWADGQSVWPTAEWVPDHLRGKKVPDMRQHLLGGAVQQSDVGVVWNAGKIPQQTVSLQEREELIPPTQAFPRQNLMAMVNADMVGAAGADQNVVNGRTMVRIPIKRYGGGNGAVTVPKTELKSADTNPRHVMCRWIIRVR